MYLIAGLGNPGPQYEHTRHNIGQEAVEQWGKSLGVTLKSLLFRSKHAPADFRGNPIVLLCPLTFMNKSGESVRDCIRHYDLETKKLLVIHDDLDMPLGKIKVVRDGGAGGHRGVSSIIHLLGSSEFSRVKIGIGRPRHGEAVADYVLNCFYDDEKKLAEKIMGMAVKASQLFVLEGVEAAMNHINCRRLII
ncbi:MAG: aminoacyl-tRNA hydrolase [Deltaproteobacteria bacterium]|nr:aminoacyl-tRNA hydrolase [Deltaproteobacteria bacterium]